MKLILLFFILTVLTFFLVRFIFNKINPNWSRLGNPFLWLTTLLFTPLICMVLLYAWVSIETYVPERNFNKEAWTENTEKRYEYADDLVDNQKLIGLTKSEITEMLGEPDDEDENTMTYYLGISPKHLFALDPDWLEIKFEKDVAQESIIYRS